MNETGFAIKCLPPHVKTVVVHDFDYVDGGAGKVAFAYAKDYADVVNYDFYREENIYVYDGKFDLNSVFFTKPYMEIDQPIYERYSLHNWLKIVLDI